MITLYPNLDTIPEAAYLVGVTSAIQTQLNARQNTSAFTAWATDTFTGTWVTNTTYAGFSQRVGDTLNCRIKLTLAGAPNAVALNVNIPQSLVIDTAKVVTTTGGRGTFGTVLAVDEGTEVYPMGSVAYSSNTAVAIWSGQNATGLGPMSQVLPFTFGNTDQVYINFSVPITGWSF